MCSRTTVLREGVRIFDSFRYRAPIDTAQTVVRTCLESKKYAASAFEGNRRRPGKAVAQPNLFRSSYDL